MNHMTWEDSELLASTFGGRRSERSFEGDPGF